MNLPEQKPIVYDHIEARQWFIQIVVSGCAKRTKKHECFTRPWMKRKTTGSG